MLLESLAGDDDGETGQCPMSHLFPTGVGLFYTHNLLPECDF